MSQTIIETHLPIALVEEHRIIIREDRQRKEFTKEQLIELAESIRDEGLINPLTLERGEDGALYLLAGERRLRCIRALAKQGKGFQFQNQTIDAGWLPAVVWNEMTELQREELELSENLHRVDLTWQERVRATERLTTLRTKQAEASGEDAPTRVEVAKELNVSSPVVSTHLNVAKHLDDPDVAKAKSVNEAVKVIQKKLKTEDYARKAASVNTASLMHTFLKGDCRELIKSQPENKFSVIVTDPPYGIDMHKDQSWDGTYHEYDDTEAYVLSLLTALIPEWDRVTKDEAHMYLFCDIAKFNIIRAIFSCYRTNAASGEVVFHPEYYQLALQSICGCREDSARADRWDAICEAFPDVVWDVMYFPMIWNKGNIASYPKPDHWPRKSYECILYAIKGNKQHIKLDLAVVDIPQIRDQEHPAGKPKELYKHLLARSIHPGDDVLDCFAGQNNFTVAAHELKCIATAFELSDQYFDLGMVNISTNIGA